MTRSRRRHASQQPARHRRVSRDELKARRRAAAEKLSAATASDPIDNLSGDQLMEQFEPLPAGLDQLGDLPEPERKLPWWVD